MATENDSKDDARITIDRTALSDLLLRRRRNFPDRTRWTPAQHVAELERKVELHRGEDWERPDGAPGWLAWQEELEAYRRSVRGA